MKTKHSRPLVESDASLFLFIINMSFLNGFEINREALRRLMMPFGFFYSDIIERHERSAHFLAIQLL